VFLASAAHISDTTSISSNKVARTHRNIGGEWVKGADLHVYVDIAAFSHIALSIDVHNVVSLPTVPL
jgi:hypothetical protein